MPVRWRCAACGPRRESGDYWCGSRLMKLILIVSHFLVRGQSKRELHKELMHNFMEPCAGYWILFIKLGPRHHSGQSWKCRSRRPCAIADDWEASKAWCVDRQELFLYLTSQLLQDKHTWTFRPGLQERDVCTLILTKSILALPGWICMPITISQIQVLPGLGCSSVLQSWTFVHGKGN